MKAVQTEIDAWQKARNAQNIGIEWRFTTKKARYNLQRLYPSIS
jgi:hypothetical protein